MHPNDWIVQQDNASIHASSHSIKLFTKEGIFLLEQPARSSDQNPIEDLWEFLVSGLFADDEHYSTDELKEAIKKAWDDTDALVLLKLVRSTPKRCEAVVRANGAKTKK